MKKTLITLAIVLAAANAQAKNYIGIEGQANSLNYKDKSIEGIAVNSSDYYDDSTTNLGFILGHDLKRDLAMELTYSRITTSKNNRNTGLYNANNLSQELTSNTTANYNIIDFDLLKSFNLENNTSIFFTGGLKLLRGEFEERFNFLETNSVTKYGYGVGGGLGFAYNFNDRLQARVKFKYSLISGLDSKELYGHDGLSNMSTFATGVNYKF